MATILSRRGEDPAKVDQAIQRTTSAVCSAFGLSLGSLAAVQPRCPAEFKFYAKPVLNGVAVLQGLGTAYTDSCTAFTQNTWTETFHAKIEATIATAEQNPGAVPRCECDHTPAAERPRSCELLGSAVLSEPFEWDIVAAAVESDFVAAEQMELVHNEAGRNLLRQYLAQPDLQLFREEGWTLCREDGKQGLLGKLHEVRPEGGLDFYIQYCGTELNYRLEDDQGTAVTTGKLGGGASSNSSISTWAEHNVPPAGTVVLAGPVRSFRCANPDRWENDVLSLRVGDTEIAQLTPNLSGYFFDPPEELDIETLFSGAGLNAAVGPRLRLTGIRLSPACSGRYGRSEYTLFTLELGNPLVVTPEWGGEVKTGDTVQFHANHQVTWSASAGTIDANGLYTAPTDAAGPITVTAEAVLFPGHTAQARLQVWWRAADVIGTLDGTLELVSGTSPCTSGNASLELTASDRGPGHTGGGAAYRLGDILFTGDTVVGHGDRVGMLPFAEDSKENRASIKRLSEIEFSRIACGHGGIYEGVRSQIEAFTATN